MILISVVASVIVLVGLFVLYMLSKSVYLVQQAEVIVIERFGQFHRILTAGLHFIVPFVDEPRTSLWVFVQEVDKGRYYRMTRPIKRIDLRETVYDFPKQQVITKDNVVMQISAMLYYQITDVKSAVYAVANLPEAIERLTHSTLRNVIGELDLDETLTSRDQINHKLRDILDEASDKWGVKINRVELQEVTPPEDIRHAMEKQMRAERERRAVIKEAEGVKAAAILEAEGKQQSQVLAADGAAQAQLIAAHAESQARVTLAQAEGEALAILARAVPNSDPVQYRLALQYIQVLPKVAEGKDNKLIIIPYEASSLVGSLAGIKEILKS